MQLESYALGRWMRGAGAGVEIASAVTGETVATATSQGLEFGAMVDHARTVGGPALRRLTFHERAEMLKALAQAIVARKEELYALSAHTGATRADGWIDIEGGIGTALVFASKGRRELPNDRIILDGGVEALSKGGTFVARHILTSMEGVALHINAFNFPVWGPLEKFAPALLAGVPVITKPATQTAYLTEKLVRIIVESGILPAGTLQLVTGSLGDLLDHLDGRDTIGFTGSAATGAMLKAHPAVTKRAARFVAEQDSLNATILGTDVTPEAPEFDLAVREIAREMTVKAGQKCTAIRRILAPRALVPALIEAVSGRLKSTRIGDPRAETTRMGALASLSQREDVRAKSAEIGREAERVFGDPETVAAEGVDTARGAFLSPMLFHCGRPDLAARVHAVEAFGPVATVMGYGDIGEAVDLARRGAGSLVASLVTHHQGIAREVVLGLAPWHGRVLVLDRDCAKESTGHGSPLAHLVHGGPGRAGGGEEMGGVRGVHHYMQRTAIQGSPAMLTAIGGAWVKGAPEVVRERHPFRYRLSELELGQSFHSAERVVTLEDIEHFAHFTGDTFYAHMDAEAVKGHPFFPGRVAHGYLLLAFAAGLFVDPPPGPVLANYGLDSLRFVKPVEPGTAIKVRLTVKQKQPRNAQYGEVRWDVEITTGAGETAATYELLTMNTP